MKKLLWLGLVTGTFWWWGVPAQAQITPGGSGTVVNQTGQQFNITGGTQAGRNLFHSFQQFGLHQGQTANFFSNPAIANILARVNGGSVSYINGLIQVLGGNSNLFLMNPAGIVFGANASLNVPASFTATTADKIMFAQGTFNAYGDNQYSQLVGEPIGFIFSSSKPGIIINEGDLRVNPGQSLNLLAGQVINTGTLTAPAGSVSITAVPGERWVRLSQPGHLLSLEFDRLAAANMMVDNTIPIIRLPELVAARGAQANSTLTVQNNTVKLGGTVIPDQAGTAIVSGKIDVASTSSTGGQVGILGQQIALLNSEIDASGRTGGGQVWVGGNYLGRGPLPNAQYTFVSRDSVIKSDALQVGNGGEVIIWADKTTRFFGNISAKGGVEGGNGGFVEVSGKENLTFDGLVDTSAPQGKAGTLLLDPENIIIQAIGADDAEISDSFIFFGDSPGATFTISSSALATQLGFGFVQLQATNDIIFNSAVTPGTGSLQVNAGNNIAINADLSVNYLDFYAGQNITTGNITATSGYSYLEAGQNITTGNIIASTGTSLRAGQNVTTGNITATLGEVEIDAYNGGITTGTIIAGGTNGEVALNAATTIRTGDVLVTGSGANATFIAKTEIRTGNIFTTGGSVGISSGVFDVNTAGVDISGVDPNDPSTVRFRLENLNLADVRSRLGVGGDITTGNITTQGGDIGVVTAGGKIQTGNLDSSNSSGKAGLIGVAAFRDVVVQSARAQSASGIGGDIGLGSLSNVRVTGTNSSGASISTNGGSIFILYEGTRPFTIGNASVNGTAGSITTGRFTLSPFDPITFLQLGEFSLQSGSIFIFPFIGASAFNQFNTVLLGTEFGSLPTELAVGESDEELLDTSDFARLEIAEALGAGDFNAIASLDNLFSDEFANFLGVSEVNNFKSVDEVGGMLSRLAKETGKRTAIVYIMVDERQLTLAAITPGSGTKVAQPGILQVDPAVVSATQPLLGLAQLQKQVQPIVRSLPAARRSQLMPVVERFFTVLKDPRQRASDAYLKDAQQLYQWLIAPLESELKAQGIDTLMLSMDSGLRLLPVSALHDGQQFLVEKYSIALIPSVNLVDTRYRNIRGTQVLAMGADTFANQAPLPAVPVELKLITQTWPGQAFLNQDFTVQKLTQARLQGGYPIVHLATHADFQPGRLNNSYIEFGNNQRLLLPQLRDLPLRQPEPVELFTLSACRTSVGDTNAELGFAGLAVQSGVKSALASLWYVSDEGTLALMSEFYKDLRQAPIKAEALRQAQIAMLRGQVTIQGGELRGVRGGIPVPPVIAQRGDQNLSHPYYWSAFTLIGSPW